MSIPAPECETHFNVSSPCCAVCLVNERDRYREALREIKTLADEAVARGPAPFTSARLSNVARVALVEGE